MKDFLVGLSSPDRSRRLAAVRAAGEAAARGEIKVATGREVNNHIHTTYSFSPYSPSHAAFMAWTAGLAAAGSIDHDSISAAEEMTRACAALGIGSTVGAELRVNFSGTPLAGRKINNPDTENNAYIVIHGVPHQKINEVKKFLEPINQARNLRNRKEVETLNTLLAGTGVETLDFERDVVSLSQAHNGGSITERHILYALCVKLLERAGKGAALIEFGERNLGLGLTEKLRSLLLDESNPHYIYDLLGVLKGSFVPRFFIQPDDTECVPVSEAVDFANAIGAVSAYSYLGDVDESPTGDKKAERFEDAFLDELFPLIKETGFKGVAYMPPRNTPEQLARIKALCTRYDFMEISGVDINSSRQSFNCPELLLPEYSHLIDNTWALIAHEHLASGDIRYALFSPDNPLARRSLSERIRLYSRVGRETDWHHPETVFEKAGLLEGK